MSLIIEEANTKRFSVNLKGPLGSKDGIRFFSTQAVLNGKLDDGRPIYQYNVFQHESASSTSEGTLIGTYNNDRSSKSFGTINLNEVGKKDRLLLQNSVKRLGNLSNLSNGINNSIKTLDLPKDKDELTNDELSTAISKEKVISGTRQSYENLVYPTTLRRSNNDRLKISILSPTESESERKGGKGKAIGSVTLPPPGKITDNNKVDFKSGTLNPLELALAEAGLGVLLDDDTERLQKNIDNFVGGNQDLKTIVSGLFVGKAINKSANAILSREAGAIINPNMQLLFNGPSLRPFSFNYKMSPRDRGESVQVQKIIRMFKQSSAVQRTETNFFLRSPNRYRLEFLTGSDSPHRFLPKIKTCSLLGFGVDYTPENSYMSYENNSMVAYTLTFSFQEIEPIFNDEYSKLNDADVGF